MSSTHQRSAGDTRDRLIESHLPLVKALARRYAGLGAELDDLVQVGAVGLVKAGHRFDPGKGVAFATFATPTIEGEIRHHLRDRSSGLRIPRALQRLSRDIRRCQSELTSRLGRAPSTAELAAALDIDAEEVERALAAERARDSLPLRSDEETAPAASPPEPATESDDRLMLATSMRALDDRERRIVYLRFHADKTERQIARELGISQAHVSRLLTAALTKLRHHLEAGPVQSPRDTSPEGVISPDSEASRTRRRGGRDRPDGGRAAAPPPSAADMERLRAALRTWLGNTGGDAETMPDANGRQPPSAASGAGGRSDSGQRRQSGGGHSGRFLVRMPSTLHEQLARAAERENVSLNRFVTDALAATVSSPPPTESLTARGPDASPEPATAAATEAAPEVEQPPARPPAHTMRAALAANLIVLAFAAAVAVVLLVLALQRGI